MQAAGIAANDGETFFPILFVRENFGRENGRKHRRGMPIEAEGKENNGWLLEVGFGDEYNPLRV